MLEEKQNFFMCSSLISASAVLLTYIDVKRTIPDTSCFENITSMNSLSLPYAKIHAEIGICL